MKISQSFLCSKDGSKFWWLPWFPAQNNTCAKICNTVSENDIFFLHLILPCTYYVVLRWHTQSQSKTAQMSQNLYENATFWLSNYGAKHFFASLLNLNRNSWYSSWLTWKSGIFASLLNLNLSRVPCVSWVSVLHILS